MSSVSSALSIMLCTKQMLHNWLLPKGMPDSLLSPSTHLRAWLSTSTQLLFAEWIQKCLTLFLFFFFCFLGPQLQHMEVPRLGVELELQLPAYTTATAMPDPSCVCKVHCSSQQSRILNPLIEAGDRTRIFIDTSQVFICWATMGTPNFICTHHVQDT